MARNRVAVAVALACAAVLAACSSAPEADGQQPDRAAVRINAYPGGSASWLTQIAVSRGLFDRHNLDVEVVSIANGPQVVNAFRSGSLEVAIIDPTVALPLMGQGERLRLAFADSTTFFSLVGAAGQPARAWPESVRALRSKSIGVLALGSANHALLRLLIKGADLTDADVTYVATGSVPANVAALQGGRVPAAMVEVLGYCQLVARGFPVLFSYLAPSGDPAALPAGLRELVGLPENTYWVRPEWADRNADAMRRLQLALLEAGQWATAPQNTAAVADLLRGSAFNVPSLSDEQWRDCVGTGVKAWRLSFSPANADTWISALTALGVTVAVPPAAEWIDAGVPADPSAVAATIERLERETS